MVQSRLSSILVVLALTVALAGCDLVGDVLEFGFWVIVIIVAVIVALILWAARKFRRPPGGPPPAP